MSAEEKLRKLAEAISKCKRCSLYAERRNAVPGEGSSTATVMFIGEAPGRKEDDEGRPFVGQAGKVLDDLLCQAGIKRSEVFICNVVRCIPLTVKGGVRPPSNTEIEICSPYLDAQIETVNPSIIVTLGGVSIKHLFDKFGIKASGISRIHGQTIQAGRFKLMPMYHPAASLYNPRLIKEMKRDFTALSNMI